MTSFGPHVRIVLLRTSPADFRSFHFAHSPAMTITPSSAIATISPISADKIYAIILAGPDGQRPRQAEKAVALCRRSWRVVHRLHPGEFSRDVPNPWDGVTMQRRIKGKKQAVTREQVYAFAQGAVERGRPEAAAAVVICYEWLQRPENVLAGVLRWPDYRSSDWPNAIKILHHKTGATVWHPLEDTVDGTAVQFYPEAEAVLAKLPRRGVPMILREIKTRNGVVFKPYSYSGFEKIVQQLRKGNRWFAEPLYARRLPARWHDRVRGSRVDRRTRPRAVGAQDGAGVSRLCERNLGTRVVGDTKTPCAQAGERNGDKHSE
jgi:hypothetical protein